MQTVLLVVHMMIAASLVAVVLMQRSEGGALGTGGASFMSGRGAANALTRLTAYLAAGFFVTSIMLALIANHSNQERSVLEAPAAAVPAATTPATGTGDAPGSTATGATPPPARGGVLDKLQTPGGGQIPVQRAPQGR